MSYLAESIKEQVSAQGKGKWESKPYSVTCTKTAALEAECVERYKPYSGEVEGAVEESVRIAPDGKTYRIVEHPEVEGVGEKAETETTETSEESG